jgi:tungstate transport system substrate-binding protein
MYNDFVIVGPEEDPAGIKGGNDAVAALKKIAASGATFASRGDDSGTHKAELSLWMKAGVEPSGDWYRELGAGMGATLNTSAEMPAYTLTDRATWLAFENRRGLDIVVEGDPNLFNQYGVDLGEPGQASAREGQTGSGLHQLATVSGGAAGDRRLRDRRATAPERGR